MVVERGGKEAEEFQSCDEEDDGSSTSIGLLGCDVSSRVERRGEASPLGGRDHMPVEGQRG